MADIDYRAAEIAATLAEARQSKARTLRWLGVALALTVTAGVASAAGSPVLAGALVAWSVPALWQVAVWGRAADDDVALAEWMGGRS